MIQDFSAVRQAVHTAIPQFTVRCHHLTLPPSLVNRMKIKNYYRRRYQKSGFRPFHSPHQLISHVLISRLSQPRNSKWASILGTLIPQANSFWKIAEYFTNPALSVPPLFDHGVQVFNSADKAEPLAQHVEGIQRLNLHVGTANHARIVNRTANKYFSRPNHTSPRLSSQSRTNSDV
jgi:hypothetical protein